MFAIRIYILFFFVGFTIVSENGVSCSCRLTQPPEQKQSNLPPPGLSVELACTPLPLVHEMLIFFFLSAEPRGGRSSLHTLKDLRAITEQPQLLIYLVVLLFVYFCIKVRVK